VLGEGQHGLESFSEIIELSIEEGDRARGVSVLK
jgi:hypothetical protein